MKKSLLLLMLVGSFCVLNGCGSGGTASPDPVTLSLTPEAPQSLDAGQSATFTGSVANDSSNRGVNWRVICSAGVASCGSMAQAKTSSGSANQFNAPANVTASETLTVTAAAVADPTKSSSVQVTVNPQLALVNPPPAQPAPVTAGQAFSLSLMSFVQGGTQPVTWSIKSGTLPPGLKLDAATGMVTGTPTAAATGVVILFTCSDSGQPPIHVGVQISITVNPPPPLTITSGGPPDGVAGRRYSPFQYCVVSSHFGCLKFITCYGFKLTASGGVPPLTWSWVAATGSSSPPGLFLGFSGSGYGSDCPHIPAIVGTPTTAGTYKVIVTVKDSQSQPASVSTPIYTITITNPPPPSINTTPPPAAGALNLPYQFAFTATNGLAPLTWSESGALPRGLALGSEGTLSGTPTSTGSYAVTVAVKDSLGRDATGEDFTIQVYPHGFKATGSMGSARSGHTATLLDTGMVLVAGGGIVAPGAINTADLYDPATGSFSVTGSMSMGRFGHTATKLDNGKVLITGGPDANTGLANGTAELYDPSTGTFVPTGEMNETRFAHTATLLKTGKVLVVGGDHRDSTRLASAELYDPSTGIFSLTGSLAVGRSAHTATLLEDGRVLITGGNTRDDVTGDNPPVGTAELYDSSHGTFTLVSDKMSVARSGHAATLLSDGSVLLTGGGMDVVSAERFDPANGTFTSTGDMSVGRVSHTATVLADDTVLVAGGGLLVCCPHGITTSGAELFDPSSGTFTGTGSMTSARFSHTATPLKDGKVLVTGGIDTSGHALSTAEIYR